MNHLVLEQLVNDLLQVNLFQDYCPNGLQIQGRTEISKIATAVTASRSILQQAIAVGADALLVHHGYFWKGESPCIRGIKKDRIALAIKHEMNLFAYHLPLDAYLDFGNNASIAKKIGLNNLSQQANGLLWSGYLQRAHTSKYLLSLLLNLYGEQCKYIGPELSNILKISFCSGGGQDFFEQAILAGADVFLSGEYSERVFHLAHESGVGYVILGHHASEKDGIFHLGNHLEKHYGFEHVFFDENNPL
jgi:dinuclear metal center YbgI/SA1388 family protein